MSFIDLETDLANVKEKAVVPEGMYDLVIESAKGKSKDGKDNILVILGVEGNLDAANILHNISLPSVGDDAEKITNKLLFIKRFLAQFHIVPPVGTIDPMVWAATEFPGKTGRCKVVLDEYNGIVSNKLKL